MPRERPETKLRLLGSQFLCVGPHPYLERGRKLNTNRYTFRVFHVGNHSYLARGRKHEVSSFEVSEFLTK